MFYEYKALVKRVIDGDTFVAEILTMGFNVKYADKFRLLGVDTPETWRPKTDAERAHGKRATAFVTDLIEGKEVYLRSRKSGKYGRWLADVYVPYDPEQRTDILGLESSENRMFDNGPAVSLADLLRANDLVKRSSYG